MNNEIILPTLENGTLPAVKEIITALNLPREVLASDEEIVYAWRELPRELRAIPENLRGDLLARMCIATSVGLFDGAINYVWNASVNNLRKKVKDFGYNVVGQILQKQFEEKDLYDMKDAELLELCLQINLISEDGYYFLSQCRDIRNNYSAAHPNNSMLDDRELIIYLNRCGKYALSTSVNAKGVDVSEFMSAIKVGRFTQEQLEVWNTRLKETHQAQRDLLFSIIHGLYCDSNSNEQIRSNCLKISKEFVQVFSPNCISDLLNRHYEYKAKGKEDSYSASQQFFEKLGLIGYFAEGEKHSIVSKACSRLMLIHQGYDNFYNEPPFAERLYELTNKTGIPESTKEEFVKAVTTCYVGNIYGYSRSAIKYYEEMIKNFTPKEIEILLSLNTKRCLLKSRIDESINCKKRYRDAVMLIEEKSVPISLKIKYNKLKNNR
ncbi:hypothetical protein ACJDT4_10675 [Clostridium neuense]|uniref:Uncharacterized protein n=1 Tax=Clostridium neuense TaxID=1728934 RepID=A0ABW8TF88_9CLOT